MIVHYLKVKVIQSLLRSVTLPEVYRSLRLLEFQTFGTLTFRHHASYIYRTDVPLLPTQAPCILYIGQTYRYSPHRHHASYI